MKIQFFTIKKRKRNSQKLSLNLASKVWIKNEFYSWLCGIEEDDPLPPEISCICFCFDFVNNAVNLSMSGFESMPSVVDNGSYFPLEAQHFFCEMLNAFVNNKSNFNSHGKLMEKVKLKIFAMFENIIKSFVYDTNFEYLQNKKIIIGEFLRKKSKSFKFA